MSNPLRILHILRAPVGGLFRHVRDLATEQARRGHAVGVMVDSSARDGLTRDRLEALGRLLPLGLHALPMGRMPGLSDAGPAFAARRLVASLAIDVVHGHGAKGGLYARLGGTRPANRIGAGPLRFYTPHGGSLHLIDNRLTGPIYLAAERALARLTDGLIFESGFAQKAYERAIPGHGVPQRVIYNGLTPADFEPRTLADAPAPFLFVGELRLLKGVDVLIEALARIGPDAGRAVIVGDGPDAAAFKALTHRLGLGTRITFTGAMAARQAFGLGRVLVMPSRAESLPYIALEAAAAGIPLIATQVGGVPEIVAGSGVRLVQPGDVDALACAMAATLDTPETAHKQAEGLRGLAQKRFTVSQMCDDVLTFYADARVHEAARCTALAQEGGGRVSYLP
ncbi:MAG: glycosyltransferase family 4 protein [Hyphomicrobiaceae bacterium]|nr:glycosyltransferase family 4 protein [Hyphomicrobiaceae bacterium]